MQKERMWLYNFLLAQTGQRGQEGGDKENKPWDGTLIVCLEKLHTLI